MSEKEDNTKAMNLDELTEFATQMRETIAQQRRQMESIPLVKSILNGEITLPLEVQLLAHTLFYIDNEAADILAKSTLDPHAIQTHQPKRTPARALKKLRG